MSNWIRGLTGRGDGAAPADPASRRVQSAIDRLSVRVARVPATRRVWALTVVLTMLASVIFMSLLYGDKGHPIPVVLPWPLIALGFMVAELKVVEVHFRRETHAFSLSEFPAVIGLFFLPPGEYLLAVLVGSGAAMVLGQRQRFLKVAFNLANYGLIAVVSYAIVQSIAVMDGAPGLRDWVAAFAATTVATVISSVTIASVITLSGGAPQFQKLPEMIQFGSMVALANTSLALLAVMLLWLDPALLWLLILPLVMIFIAYRAFVSEREKHERLELLYQSSRILQHSPEIDSTLVALLSHARTMFRAELAEVVLYPRVVDEEALRTSSWHDRGPAIMVPYPDFRQDPLHQGALASSAPFIAETREPSGRVSSHMVGAMRGESEIIGSIVITNRLTEGTTFSDDDLRLLETLANQAAVALENGHLEQSLAELSRLKEQLRYQAYHDPLTGLPNRSQFLEDVVERIGLPGEHRPVVLFLDLDDFKMVNDTLGHDAGDRLLTAVGARVRSELRAGDIAARLGGDEFAVLLEDDPSLRHALSVAERIVDAMHASFIVDGQEIQVGVSIGIAAARPGPMRADELMRNADVAMYTAKSSGKNRVSVFEPTMHAAIVARHELSAELSRSLGRGELVVHYQPIVEIASGTITGVEALVRWRHPVRGLIGPSEFVQLAEETGSILQLGRFVLETACRQAAAWSTELPNARDLTMSVNLAAQQLQEASFVDDLTAILHDSGLRPGQLLLEMTETVMFHDTSTTLARLTAIRDLGVRIAIDDFGTGYSSLRSLRRFPVDVLKIAQEFLGPSDDETAWAFASAVITLGRSLGLTVIAEGIEQEAQLRRLQALGCELGQGFHFARGDDAAVIASLLSRCSSLPPQPGTAPHAGPRDSGQRTGASRIVRPTAAPG